MDLGVSAKLVPLLEEVRSFIEKEILPVEVEFYEDIAVGDRWEWTQRQTDIREGLKTKDELYRAWALRDAAERGEQITQVETGSAGALR